MVSFILFGFYLNEKEKKKVSGKSIPKRDTCMCKGPEREQTWCVPEINVVGAEWMRGKWKSSGWRKGHRENASDFKCYGQEFRFHSNYNGKAIENLNQGCCILMLLEEISGSWVKNGWWCSRSRLVERWWWSGFGWQQQRWWEKVRQDTYPRRGVRVLMT